jgi:hypothetical protein
MDINQSPDQPVRAGRESYDARPARPARRRRLPAAPDGGGERPDRPAGRPARRPAGCGLRAAAMGYVLFGVVPALTSAGATFLAGPHPLWERAVAESGLAAAVFVAVLAAAAVRQVSAGERPSTAAVLLWWAAFAHLLIAFVIALGR